MEEKKHYLEQILSILKEKHKQMDNLMTLTKELERVMVTGDPESFGAVLNMRQASMETIDQHNEEVRQVLLEMEEKSREKIKMILGPELPENITFRDCPIESGIFETNKMTLALLRKIIALDDEINKKMKGG